MIAGLVLTRQRTTSTDMLEAALQFAPCTIGEHHGWYSTVALEAANQTEMQRWHDWLLNVPGVLNVDVAFVSLEQE